MSHTTDRAQVREALGFRMVEQDSDEWRAIWRALGRFYVVPDGRRYCPACHNGECWQYMGTWDGSHEFRHRDYPGHGGARPAPAGRTYARVRVEGREAVLVGCAPVRP